MPDCMTPGQLNADGPCTLFTQVNDNGLNLYTCAEFTYTPAACPDDPTEGTVNAGAASAKIASVDGTVPDVCVQRDSVGMAHAQTWQVDGNDCSNDSRATRVGAYDVSIGAQEAVLAADPLLRLRGYGDTPAFGGSQPLNDVGYLEIRRLAFLNGLAIYTNVGSPVASVQGHLFANSALDPAATQDLMELNPTQGILYFPSWTYVSDVRLKSDIAPLDGQAALGVVMGISPIAYTMHGQRYHGFSAQDVQTVLPDAVKDSPTKDGLVTMREGDIVANLVAAVKFLAARVEALEKQAGV